MRANLLCYEEISSNFRYSEKSVSKLEKLINGKWVDVTGKNIKGYYRASFKGKRLYAHRIIWLLSYPTYDQSLDIDHIDGNKSNNSHSNLRLVSRSTNLKNKKGKNYKNIFWEEKRQRYHLYWQTSPNRRKSIVFTCARYEDKQSCLLAALRKREELIQQGLIYLTKEDM